MWPLRRSCCCGSSKAPPNFVAQLRLRLIPLRNRWLRYSPLSCEYLRLSLRSFSWEILTATDRLQLLRWTPFLSRLDSIPPRPLRSQSQDGFGQPVSRQLRSIMRLRYRLLTTSSLEGRLLFAVPKSKCPLPPSRNTKIRRPLPRN